MHHRLRRLLRALRHPANFRTEGRHRDILPRPPDASSIATVWYVWIAWMDQNVEHINNVLRTLHHRTNAIERLRERVAAFLGNHLWCRAQSVQRSSRRRARERAVEIGANGDWSVSRCDGGTGASGRGGEVLGEVG